MTKHTPGPWRFVKDGKDRRIIGTSPSGTEQTLMCDTRYYPWCHESDEDWALIAAAPDLLESLQEMCSVWATVCNSKGWDPDHVSQYTKARAAISKATGTTNSHRGN